MKPKQEEAIRKLRAAIAACKSAGVCLIGMGDSLTAYDRAELMAAGWGGANDPHIAMTKCGQGVDVPHHGVYLDSGGW